MTLDLRSLTADQPVQPPDRVASVLRRSSRIRRARAALTVAAVVALVAPVGLLARGAEPGPTSFATTPVERWPDRSQTADRGIADGALTAFRRLAAAQGHDTDPAPPRWLYRGTVHLPDGDDACVAVFLTRKDGRDVVVTSSTRRAQVDDGGESVDGPGDGTSSPWTAQVQPLTPGLDHVGLYLGYRGAEPRRHPVLQVFQEDVRDVLLVLADPGTRRLTWTHHPLPSSEEATGRAFALGGELRSHDGVFTGVAGPLGGPVTVVLTDATGGARNAGDLSPGSAPYLAPPSVPDAPAGWQQHVGAGGTSQRQSDGSWSGPVGLRLDEDLPAGDVVVVGRCYGGGVLRVELGSPDGPPAARGPLPCDGQSHQALRVVPPSGTVDVTVPTADRLVAVELLVGTVPGR